MTTKGYNRFFMRLLQAVTAAQSEPHLALRKVLLAATADSELWPSDEAFRAQWLRRPVYLAMKPARVPRDNRSNPRTPYQPATIELWRPDGTRTVALRAFASFSFISYIAIISFVG